MNNLCFLQWRAGSKRTFARGGERESGRGKQWRPYCWPAVCYNWILTQLQLKWCQALQPYVKKTIFVRPSNLPSVSLWRCRVDSDVFLLEVLGGRSACPLTLTSSCRSAASCLCSLSHSAPLEEVGALPGSVDPCWVLHRSSLICDVLRRLQGGGRLIGKGWGGGNRVSTLECERVSMHVYLYSSLQT